VLIIKSEAIIRLAAVHVVQKCELLEPEVKFLLHPVRQNSRRSGKTLTFWTLQKASTEAIIKKLRELGNITKWSRFSAP
jgi:hypothetical protein